MSEWILLGFAGLSVLLNLWQWLAGRRFPMRRELSGAPDLPALSILKPLKGADSQTESCLRSWFEQDYPAETELLFAVAEETDPAAEIVRKLAPQFPERKSKLVVCNPILGPNAKVSSLCYLAKVATHDHWVISDADVEIGRTYLRQAAATLQSRHALVNSFYILRPLNLPMALEAVAVNADFWSQVLQGIMLKPMDFALGAVMVTSKEEVQKAGGFEGLLDDLADDYQLGNRIARGGGTLGICALPVTCWSDEQSWKEVWDHQVRWARTIRVCQPAPYFFSILANATLWPLLALAAAPHSVTAQFTAQAALLLRALTAKDNYQRLTGANGWLAFGLASVKDLLMTAIWVIAFLGNTLTWRGQRFRVRRGGKLTPLA